jgi:APA family basic amino acid/polyamine antiporter
MSQTPRLVRRLGLTDAVLLGLGSMLGTGVFVVFGPAADAAGSGLLIGLALAAFVAYANATSSAELAAICPASGGTYVYGRERLGAFWGFLAGIGFVCGKTASSAAAALAVGTYAAPEHSRAVAALAVVFVTAVNYRGIAKTAAVNRVLVTFLLAVLAVVVVACWHGDTPAAEPVTDWFPNGAHGVLQAAGLLFFAFAGYARIATLGEEVRDPARTIPRAIPVALGIALVVYAAVAISLLHVLGADALSRSLTPLSTAVSTAGFDGLTAIVRVGAVVAALGVFLSLVAGISRTTYAMATRGDLPGWFGAVHPRYHVPHRAELAVGAVTLVIIGFGGIAGAVSFSAFTVLAYYAIANASAITLDRAERRWPRGLAIAGLIGCVALGVNLPWPALVSGTALFVAAAVAYQIRNTRRSAA